MTVRIAMKALILNSGSSSLKFIFTMAATPGGVDALAFTAGVGEHAPEIRRRACEGLAFLNVELDSIANVKCRLDTDIASLNSKISIRFITTREDLLIVRETQRLIAQQAN